MRKTGSAVSGRNAMPLVLHRATLEEHIPVGEVVEGVEWSEWEDSVLQHDTQFYADEILQALADETMDISLEPAAQRGSGRPHPGGAHRAGRRAATL